jgi:spermidine synthase
MSPRRSEALCIYRKEDTSSRCEIWDQDGRRSLWFDDVILQSEIELADPGHLPNPVNRAMLAPLMFTPSPRRVLLAGCGGGAIARWFHHHAPQTPGDAVEISAEVAQLARDYFDFPPASTAWRLICADVRDFVLSSAPEYDYLLVDLEEDQRTPDWVTAEPFLSRCRGRLSAQGTMVLNLISSSVDECAERLLAVRQAFTHGVGLLGDSNHDNLLVLARRDEAIVLPDKAVLAEAGQRWGLDFVAMASRLRIVPPAAS